MLSGLICCWFWINPLVWLLHSRLLIEAEKSCDNRVIEEGASPIEYAAQLVAFARTDSRVEGVATSLALAPGMSRPSSLAARVHALLDDQLIRGDDSFRNKIPLLIGLFGFTIILSLSSIENIQWRHSISTALNEQQRNATPHEYRTQTAEDIPTHNQTASQELIEVQFVVDLRRQKPGFRQRANARTPMPLLAVSR